MNLDEYGSASKGLIWDAIERGLPIEKYIAKKHFSFMTLNYLITVLSAKHNLDGFPFEEYDDDQIRHLLAAVYYNNNWKEWANPKMKHYIMEMFIVVKNPQELLYYYNRGFKYRELLQIYKFINDGFDPKVVDNLDFNFQQMREIRKALRGNLPVKDLANPNLTWKEIRAKRIKAYGHRYGIEFYIKNYDKL